MNHTYLSSHLHLFCPKTGTFYISIPPAGNIFRTFGFTMSAWHHIFSGSCAFGSLPKPRGRLEAHGSAFPCYWFVVFEDPIFEPYILIHIMATKDSGLCMDITYIISFVHILCACTTISIWIYTFLYIYMVCIYHDQWLYHLISNSQCIAGSGSGQGSCSLCSGTWSAGVTWEHIGIPELVM